MPFELLLILHFWSDTMGYQVDWLFIILIIIIINPFYLLSFHLFWTFLSSCSYILVKCLTCSWLKSFNSGKPSCKIWISTEIKDLDQTYCPHAKWHNGEKQQGCKILRFWSGKETRPGSGMTGRRIKRFHAAWFHTMTKLFNGSGTVCLSCLMSVGWFSDSQFVEGNSA